MHGFSFLQILFWVLLAFPVGKDPDWVEVQMVNHKKEISIRIGGRDFTRFLYPDSLEKPVLFPILDASGSEVTRGFPLAPRPHDPTDHPHHIGLWFNFESVNGLDFWNNSYAIPSDKKSHYGWIRTDKILKIKSGKTGLLDYHALWTNLARQTLLEEFTHFAFSGKEGLRIIDRTTTLTAREEVQFNDAKDGLLGIRMAHELQIPTREDQSFTDSKGIITVVKGGTDTMAKGNYLTSENKKGNDAWGTRARWCMAYGKLGNDSVALIILDHPRNPNYPTFWHARGYGLFSANPLGEKIFTNGKSQKNFHLHEGEKISFHYRIIVMNGKKIPEPENINRLSDEFASQ